MSSCILTLGFIITFILVQIKTPFIEWKKDPYSIYYYTQYRWLYISGLVMIGIAELIISSGFFLMNIKYNRYIALLFLLMGISCFLIAYIPMSIFPSIILKNNIHVYAAAVQFILFPLTSLMIGIFCKDRIRKFILIYTSVSLGVLVYLYLLLNTQNHLLLQYYGLSQKIYIMQIAIYLIGISIGNMMLRGNLD